MLWYAAKCAQCTLKLYQRLTVTYHIDLMMEIEQVSETLVFSPTMTRLIDREDCNAS
jgi:hypothetical protein